MILWYFLAFGVLNDHNNQIDCHDTGYSDITKWFLYLFPTKRTVFSSTLSMVLINLRWWNMHYTCRTLACYCISIVTLTLSWKISPRGLYVETIYCMYQINSPEIEHVQIHWRPNKKGLTALSVSVHLNGYMCGTSSFKTKPPLTDTVYLTCWTYTAWPNWGGELCQVNWEGPIKRRGWGEGGWGWGWGACSALQAWIWCHL